MSGSMQQSEQCGFEARAFGTEQSSTPAQAGEHLPLIPHPYVAKIKPTDSKKNRIAGSPVQVRLRA